LTYSYFTSSFKIAVDSLFEPVVNDQAAARHGGLGFYGPTSAINRRLVWIVAAIDPHHILAE
jgi:hypothetical protein